MKKKIISFSLWCQESQLNPHHINQHKDVYTHGAIQNSILCKKHFPEWTCRFYINNTVPQNIVDTLTSNNSEIIDMTNSNIPGMYWRFLVVDDPSVEYAIIRDSDSRLNERDTIAVNDFLKSMMLSM